MKTKTGFSGKSKIELSGNEGNSENLITKLGSTNSYEFGQNEFLALANYQYGKSTGVRNTNTGSFHLRYSRLHAAWWASEVFGQIQYNEFQKLERRDLLGLGARLGLFSGESQFLFLGIGVFFENEKIEEAARSEDFRGNIYLSYYVNVLEKYEFSTIVYYQPRIQSYKDFRLQVRTSFEVKILSFLSLLNSFSLSHDSRPPGEIELTDISYLVGVSLSY